MTPCIDCGVTKAAQASVAFDNPGSSSTADITAYCAALSGDLQAFQPGRHVIYRREDVLALIERRRAVPGRPRVVVLALPALAEHVDHEPFASREQAHASIADYIERFYNTARRHSSLGYVSPIEFELRS